jgi:hypothetical protein
MDLEKFYYIIKGVATAIAVILNISAVVSILLSRSSYESMASAGFLVMTLFFTLQIWVITKTKWDDHSSSSESY